MRLTDMQLTFMFLHAEAEAAYLQGQGIARQRQAIVNGLRESVLNFEDGVKAVSPQEVIELMMVSLSSKVGMHCFIRQRRLVHTGFGMQSPCLFLANSM